MEAESEIATGFNIEYTALMFGMFFVAEFLHAFAVSALMATLFLGGWRGPGAEAYPLLGLVYFFIKTSIVWFSIIWVRMSLPRVRIDQMLALNWKLLTPVALGVVVVTAVAEKLAPAAPLGRALVLLGANGVVLVIAVLGLAVYGRTRRERPVFGPAGTGAPASPSIQASAR
jgi:NADH-quinone oxidoreductase subunit H